MSSNDLAIKDIVLQPYVVEILKELKTPKRFKDLIKITTAQTLSVKLTKLKKYGLITSVPVSIKDNYANGYVLTDKGRKIIKVLETIK